MNTETDWWTRPRGRLVTLLAWTIMAVWLYVMCAAVVSLSGCIKCSEPGIMRCDGTAVVVCGGTGTWVKTRDCKDTVSTMSTNRWTCGTIDTLPNAVGCIPDIQDGGTP